MFRHGAKQLATARPSPARSLRGGFRKAQFQQRYYSSPRPTHLGSNKSTFWTVSSVAIVGVATVTSISYAFGGIKETYAEAPPTPVDVTVEEPRTKDNLSKEQNRELLSSQHVQVKRSWEHPGVYVWGSNSGRVANPDSNEAVTKTPQRIPYFDGLVLRDLKVDQNSGAAISENGDLIQWGRGYTDSDHAPTKSLTGKDLVSLSLSRSRIIALSSRGDVYSLPISKAEQESGQKPLENSWLPFWKTKSRVSYRPLKPNLQMREKVTATAGGLEHVLLLTSSGRVFSAASGSDHYPSRGQLGLPGLTWATRPDGPYDFCHEVSPLRGFKITNIAAGDYHSLALEEDGRVFAFGDNSSGQLGFDFESQTPFSDTPQMLPLRNLYKNKDVKATGVAAGGATSFFMVNVKDIARQGEGSSNIRNIGRVTADTLSCGRGIFGTLGNGKWTHLQDQPTKVKALSGLFEYDEVAQKVVPIHLRHISVGSTHAAAVMTNWTNLDATNRGSQSDINWGEDALWWGGNEFYQLGTGKRNNLCHPTYISPPADAEAPESQGEHRLQITPRHTVKVGGRKVNMEQRVECGRNITAIYSGL
ncbi:hypothetical protein FQN54_007219 [Arachnomyces sp. PD_36]|nr:hypothetical protein FQN54_007219 [Arachnomyces sp. PD_36]